MPAPAQRCLRAESEELRILPVSDAAKLIETKRVERELAQQQVEQRQQPLLVSRTGDASQAQTRDLNAESGSEVRYGKAEVCVPRSRTRYQMFA